MKRNPREEAVEERGRGAGYPAGFRRSDSTISKVEAHQIGRIVRRDGNDESFLLSLNPRRGAGWGSRSPRTRDTRAHYTWRERTPFPSLPLHLYGKGKRLGYVFAHVYALMRRTNTRARGVRGCVICPRYVAWKMETPVSFSLLNRPPS